MRTKSPEAFEGEAALLKTVYENYMKNVGGYQNINGHMVHVTTVLHINKNARLAVMAIENRLRELGVLPELPQVNASVQPNGFNGFWVDPRTQYVQ